jgi:TRAP-type C4-dicarboxylate transport system permease small subunit
MQGRMARIENWLSYAAVFLLVLFSVLEIVARTFFQRGFPGSSDYVQHLVIWITFLGGMITSREGRHLSLSVGAERLSPRLKTGVLTVNAFISTAVSFALAGSSLSFILLAFSPDKMVGIVPVRWATLILPLGYCVMAIRFFLDERLPKGGRGVAALGLVLGFLLSLGSLLNIVMFLVPDYPPFCDALVELYYRVTPVFLWPAFIVLILAVFLGLPLFIGLGGIAYVLLAASGASLEVIPNEAYTMLTGNSIAAIPLFTIAGFILSESKAGERLVGLFQNLFGFLPGGLAIVSVLVCAFFTTFTGASGVTILALGGLLSFILTDKNAYEGNYATGLLTASGSIGLLFPPSLPVILYGVVAGVSIKDMFIGGVIPGVIMVAALSLSGVYAAVKRKTPRSPFSLRATLRSLKLSAWEVLLPVIILLSYFMGITTLVETGAVAVLYAVVAEVFINKDLRLKDIPDVLLKSLPSSAGYW